MKHTKPEHEPTPGAESFIAGVPVVLPSKELLEIDIVAAKQLARVEDVAARVARAQRGEFAGGEFVQLHDGDAGCCGPPEQLGVQRRRG